MIRRAVILFVGLGAVVLILAASKKGPTPPAPAASAPTAIPAPASVTLVTGADAFAALLAESGKDGRPVVAHFWATWCGACVEEFPKLAPVLEAAKLAKASVLLVSVDDPKLLAKEVPAFLARYGLTGTSYLVDVPDPAPLAKLVGTVQWDGELPATFVLKDGRPVLVSIGPVKEPASILDAIR